MRNFEHTIGVLVKAYFEGTLEHGNCAACAVGNIVGACGFPQDVPAYMWDDCPTALHWKKVFYTSDWGRQVINKNGYTHHAKTVIDATGYSWEELARIEFAFETAPKGESSDDWMFNGLMAVVEVLAEIHNIDLATREETKKLFVKSC